VTPDVDIAMRIVSWNLHGAAVPGRASLTQQQAAWTYMRDALGANLILAQEAAENGVPEWVTQEWNTVSGEVGRFRKNWRWGSIIAGKPYLNVLPHEEALGDGWLAQLYDLVLVGQFDRSHHRNAGSTVGARLRKDTSPERRRTPRSTASGLFRSTIHKRPRVHRPRPRVSRQAICCLRRLEYLPRLLRWS
jgi:hypothetical protein